MKTFSFAVAFAVAWFCVVGFAAGPALAQDRVPVGVIGLDTSHAPAFANLLNNAEADSDLGGFEVVAAYPHGSETIPSSYERIPGYVEQFEEMEIAIVDSIEELLERVEVVLLTTNDGKPRLEQTRQVLAAGKPVFVDKPMAASLADVIAIFELAEHYDVPLFSSSALRYATNAPALAAGEHGEVRAVDAYGPGATEPSHPDLYWYMIHAVEPVVTVLGTELHTVTRTGSDGQDVVTGVWRGGRIGTVRGMRDMNPGFGGAAFTSDGVVDLGGYTGYEPLMVDAVRMFRSQQAPVSAEQTIAIYAFMDAADESLARGGAPVDVAEVIEHAREQARRTLAEMGY